VIAVGKLETGLRPIPAQPNKWIVFALTAVAVFMSTLDSSIVNVALPTIMKNLQSPMTTIEWVVVIYLLTVSSLLLAFGRLSDIKGRRWVYSRGFIIFVLGSFFCAVSPDVAWLISARSFQGIGAAMLMACSPALIIDIFPVAERGKALGTVGTVVASGLTIGPALGGVILDLFSWPVIFYINIPIGIAAAVLAAKILKGGRADVVRREPFDWPGALLLVICLCTFIVGLTHFQAWGYRSMRIVLLFSISILCAAALVRVERRSAYPIFDPALFTIRLFILPILAAVILFASLFSITFLMPFYLIHPSGLPVDRVGYMMVIPFVFLFFVSPVAGTISDRIGSRLLCTLGMVVLVFSLFCLAALDGRACRLSIAWRLALAGVGIALFLPPNSAVALSAVPSDRRGIASGTVATARNLGMVLGVATSALIFNSIFQSLSGGLPFKVYHSALEPHFMTAFRHALQAGGLVAVGGVVVTFLRGRESNASSE